MLVWANLLLAAREGDTVCLGALLDAGDVVAKRGGKLVVLDQFKNWTIEDMMYTLDSAPRPGEAPPEEEIVYEHMKAELDKRQGLGGW